MDPQLFQMLSQRFDAQDEVLSDISCSLKEHVQKDERYWAKLDAQETRIDLLKYILGVPSIGALVLWILQKFGVL